MSVICKPSDFAGYLFNGPSTDFSKGPLCVCPNGRFLCQSYGTPFFYLADTAWELLHRLTLPEIDRYFENRRQKGFNVIHTVLLSEFDGLRKPNAYEQLPLLEENPEKPNPDYFDFVEKAALLAAGKGLYMGLLPTWGDKVDLWRWGIGPVVFNERNAGVYGAYLGRRLGHLENIVWILGGDRYPCPNEAIWRAMADGIRGGESKPHLMSFHPIGERSSSSWLHNEPWLSFNMLQSGHAAKSWDNYSMLACDYALSPPKPCMDGEPRYESGWVGFEEANGRFTAWDVRQAAYWAVFAGAFGHTYGCQEIWQFHSPDRPLIRNPAAYWTDAADFEGAWDMLLLRRLMESRPFLTRIPDQNAIMAGHASNDSHAQATRGSDGSYLMIYLPTGRTIIPNLSVLSGNAARAWWFNPRSGDSEETGVIEGKGYHEFSPPGGEQPERDWVLVLDDAAKGYPAPGTAMSISMRIS